MEQKKPSMENSRSTEGADGEASSSNGSKCFLITKLAELPERTLLDETELADVLKVTPRTIRRMVDRFELPPPVPLAGHSVWMAGKVLDYIEESLDVAKDDATGDRERIKNYEP